MSVRVVFFALLSLAGAAGWCSAKSAELHTLKGNVLKGDLQNITDKEIVLEQNGKSSVTPLAEVLRIDFPAVAPVKLEGKYSDVELVDGSRIHCKEWTIKAKQVELTTMAGQQMNVPLAAVANILNDAQEEKYRKDWAERLARKRRRDMAVLIRDDTINAVEGTFGDADAQGKGIEFQIPSGKKGTLLFSKLHGLIFQRELDPQAPPLLCKLYDSYQDVIMVSALIWTPGGLSVTTPAGARFEIGQELLTRLDYTLDKVAYLSRLEPSKVVNKTVLDNGFDSAYPFKRDLNLNNQPLRIYGDTYSIGLALHAYTELEYDLKGDYREFHALAGIDQSVGAEDRPVVLVIEAVIDGESKELYKKTFTRRDPKDKKEGAINLNIKDVQKLRLIVRSGDKFGFDNGVHLDLVNAKIQK
jgi:hypothetical protein